MGEDLPACAWLVSPWTDVTLSGATLMSKSAVDPLIHKEYLGELADAYAPAGMDRKEPPAPIFSKHCAECEFRSQCRSELVNKDDLSLLSTLKTKRTQGVER